MYESGSEEIINGPADPTAINDREPTNYNELTLALQQDIAKMKLEVSKTAAEYDWYGDEDDEDEKTKTKIAARQHDDTKDGKGLLSSLARERMEREGKS